MSFEYSGSPSEDPCGTVRGDEEVEGRMELPLIGAARGRNKEVTPEDTDVGLDLDLEAATLTGPEEDAAVAVVAVPVSNDDEDGMRPRERKLRGGSMLPML